MEILMDIPGFLCEYAESDDEAQKAPEIVVLTVLIVRCVLEWRDAYPRVHYRKSIHTDNTWEIYAETKDLTFEEGDTGWFMPSDTPCVIARFRMYNPGLRVSSIYVRQRGSTEEEWYGQEGVRALVEEAYLESVGQYPNQWANREEFRKEWESSVYEAKYSQVIRVPGKTAFDFRFITKQGGIDSLAIEVIL